MKRVKMKNVIMQIFMLAFFACFLPLKVWASDAVPYTYYETGDAGIIATHTNGSCSNYTIVSNQTTWGTAGQTKWYVVNSSVTIADRITVNGNVHLILVDGCMLTASKGINVTGDNSLTIYGQSANESTMGVLKCLSVDTNLAGIGGNNSESSGQITINGGKIRTKGGNSAAGIGGGRAGNGSVTINGGIVTVNANSGSEGSAGIGGGYRGSGTITINGGNVTANGREGGAGIGGGGYGGATVNINDGSVVAHGGGYGPGIGSGSGSQIDRSYTATVTINGGTVDAYTGSGSLYKGAAIGCGAYTRGTVTITGGNITATTYNSGACIGGLPNDTGTNTLVTISGGNVTAKAASNNLTSYEGIGGSNCTVILGWTDETDSITSPKWGGNGNSTVSFADGKNFQYKDTHALADAASLREGATLIPFIPTEQKNVDQADVSGVRTWYPYTGSAIEPEPVVTYAGTLLTKGTDYSLSYISDHTSTGEKAVTITGKGNYTGTKSIPYEIVTASTTYLDDTGVQRTCTTFQCLDQSDTSLSAGWYLVYDDLTINDRIYLTGNVNLILKDNKTLTSMKGISVPSTASLTIYAQSNDESTAGKLVISNPDMYFSGIGSDYNFSDRYVHGNITIVGGAINARGGFSGAAIGSALSSLGGNITIKGGFITANGLVGGAGIGSGASTNGGTITISGGTVTATSVGGAAIGSGGFGDGKGTFGTINITGGTVSAKSESGGAGIGGGSNSADGTINITGGTITASASGDTGGAAIGGGKNASGGDITIQNATIKKAAANIGAGLGSGGEETSGTTTVSIGTGAIITNAVSSEGAGIGSGKNSSASCSVIIKDGASVMAGSTIGAGIGGGSSASNFSVKIQDNLTVVTANAGGLGIQDANGNLSAYGGAAIGGGANTNGGTIIISGGTVTAKAVGGGAGIGSGTNTKKDDTVTNSGTISISGGTVTATATHHAAGIGGGRRSNGGTITINGGTVISNGSDAAGIGRGGEDKLWEGKGSFYIPIIDDPSQSVGGAWYDSIAPVEGTNKTTEDGTVTFGYSDEDTVSITASSYPESVTLSKDFMYSDSNELILDGTTITPEKTIIPYDANPHVHSFIYSISEDGKTITAECTNTEGTCRLTNRKATLSISAPVTLTYDGSEKEAKITKSADVFGGTDVVYTKVGDSSFTGKPKNIGSYTAKITVGEGNNKKTASVSYTIAPKEVTLTWKNKAFTYDGETHIPSVTLGGLVGTDSCDVSVSGGAKDVGTHTATASDLTNSNYKLPTDPTTEFSIAKAEVTVSANNASKIYGEEDPELSATVTGAITGETINYTLARAAGENAGKYAITVTLGENPNYQVATVNGEFSIKKAATPPNPPTNKMNAQGSDAKVSDIPLEGSWEWAAADKDTALVEGQTINATAVYNGEDKDNYENVSVVVAIKKSDHTHSLSKTDAVAATCVNPGNSAYWTCSVCGKYFSDAQGTTEIAENAWVEAALGHSYESEYVWSDDYKTCTATATCKREGCNEETDGHVITETVNSTSETTAASCEGKGKIVYTATFTKDIFAKQTKTVETDALGHSYDVTYSWSDDGKSCIANAVCANNSSHTVSENGAVTEEVTTPATCKAMGVTTYTATFTNTLFTTQTKDVTDVDKLSTHTPAPAVSENTIPASCETDGSYDEVIRCSVCGIVISSNTIPIPAFGHDWGVWIMTKEPSETETGLYTRTCKRDPEHTETMEIPVTTHEHVFELVEEKPATCTSDGTKAYYKCTNGCDLKFSEADADKVILDETSLVIKASHKGGTATCCHKAVCDVCQEEYGAFDSTNHEGDTEIRGKVAATCTEDGYSGDIHCKACGALIEKGEIQKAEGHKQSNAVKENEVQALCDKAGSYDEVVRCSVCGEELSRKTVVVDALGHEYGAPIYEWSADGKECTATRKCSRCAKTESEKAVVTSAVKTDATTEKMGTTTYTATFKNTAFKTQNKDVEDIPVKSNDTPEPEPVPGKKGDVIKDSVSKAEFVITSDSEKNPTAEYSYPTDKSAKSVTVPDTVTVGGKTYKITSVKANAFKDSNATTVTIGKNITKLCPGAFNGSKVKTIIVKSTKLKKKTVKKSVKGCKAKKVIVKIKVGSKKLNKKYAKKYKKYFTKKNVGKKVKVK